MNSSPMVQAVVVLSILLLVGYFFGSWINRRRRRALVLWIKPAVDALGGETSVRWLGTSALHIELRRLPSPRKVMSLFLWLQPREMPLFWLLNHLRGRRDRLILKADLTRPPRGGFDLWRRGTGESYWRKEKGGRRQQEGEQWEQGELAVFLPRGGVRETARDAAGMVEESPARWEWISIRPSSPHLSALVSLSSPPACPAESIFSLMDRLSGLATGSDTPSGGRRQETPRENRGESRR